MGWNGSDGKKAAAQPKRTSKPAWQKGLAAGAIVVVAALGVVYFLRPEATEEEEEKKPSNALIGEVEPYAPAAVATEEKVEEEKREVPYWERDTTNGLTFTQLMKWHIHHRPPAAITNNTSQTEERPAYAIFKHNSENEIAALLTMEPGETLVGEPDYSRWFTHDFLKSIETPIVVKNDDPEDVQALKRDMIQVKIDLKARYDAGEDIAEVMRQTREDYQELARYKDEIRDAFREMSKDAVTEADVDDFLNAANQMLDKKGIAPMELGPIARRRLLRKYQQ